MGIGIQARLIAENAKWPVQMTPIDRKDYPAIAGAMREAPSEVWRSRDFLAQIYDGPTTRISVCRTTVDSKGEWREDISWDDLQRIKNECGFGEFWALEVFPPVGRVVNVANMRHLWLQLDAPPFAWNAPSPPADAEKTEGSGE